MLVIDRKPGEWIVINDTTRIQLVKCSKSKARLGIDAPECVSVHREEVWNAIQATKTTNPPSTSPPLCE